MQFKSDLSLSVFKSKYLLSGEKSPDDALDRIRNTLKQYNPEIADKAYEYIDQKWFLPAGGIWRAMGNPSKKVSFVNCTTMKQPEDNLESIFETLYYWSKVAAYGQGNGIDLSLLRPRGATLHNTAKTSTGPISYMEVYDSVMQVISQQGRRGATLISLSAYHPDFREFCIAKDEEGKITTANISLQVPDLFMEAVEKDLPWLLHWQGEYETIEKEERAKELFDFLSEHAWKTGDPGVQFIDTMRRESNSDLLGIPIVSSNGCCWSADTLITTKGGLFPIIDLVGKEVEIFDGQKWVLNNSFEEKGIDDIYRVTLSNGLYFDASTNHRFFMEDTETIKTTTQLAIGDRLQYNDSLITYGNHYEKGAYIKGFLCGDGTTAKKTQPVLWLYEPKYSCKERIEESLNEIPVNSTMTNTITDIGWKQYSSNINERLSLSGLSARERKSLYLWASKYKKRLPLEIFSWNLQSKYDFIAGLFDSDGTALDSRDRGVSYQLVSIHKEFLVDVLRLLSSIGIYGKLTTGNKGGIRKIRDQAWYCNETWRISIPQTYAIKLSKKVKFSRLTSFEDRYTVYNLKYRYNTVTSIEKLDRKEPVYCCNVPSTSKFYVNGGLIAGNSEQILDEHNVCMLSSINLSKFSEYGWSGYQDLVSFGIQFLDTCRKIEYEENRSPSPIQRQKLVDIPRIGLGVTGLADYFIRNKIEYGSLQSIEHAHNLFLSLSSQSYIESYNIAKKEGSFPLYDKDKYLNSPIVDRMLDAGVIDKSILNYQAHVCKTTVAPNGTLSIIAECGGSGIEPIFAKYMVRRERATTGDYKEWFIYNDLVRDYLEESELEVTKENADKLDDPWWVTAHTVDNMKKIELMSEVQNWIDSAISVTYNLPEEATVEDVKNIYFYAWKKHLKAVSIFREGSKQGILITEANYNKGEKSGNKRHAIKRPEDTQCDIHEISVDKRKHIVLVGLVGGKPYEIFITPNEEGKIDLQRHKQGVIRKVKKGRYDLIVQNGEEKTIVEDIGHTFDEVYGTLSRLVSMSLRHGVPLQFTIDQLVRDTGFNSFNRAISRVLKKYIIDGEQVMSSDKCPSCGRHNLSYQGGCKTCLSCGWSRCD